MRIAEFEPPVMIRRPSGVYVSTVVPGVSILVSGAWPVGSCHVRAGRPRGRRGSKLMMVNGSAIRSSVASRGRSQMARDLPCWGSDASATRLDLTQFGNDVGLRAQGKGLSQFGRPEPAQAASGYRCLLLLML